MVDVGMVALPPPKRGNFQRRKGQLELVEAPLPLAQQGASQAGYELWLAGWIGRPSTHR